MTMKKHDLKLIAAAAAAITAFSATGCSQSEVKAHTLSSDTTAAGNTAESFSTTAADRSDDIDVTDAAQETTTTAADTTATAENTTQTASPAVLRPGVWWAKGSYDNECYYSLRDDGTGNIRFQDMGIGVALNYTHDGSRYTFEMGGVGNYSYANVTIDSDTECTFNWEDGRVEHLTYTSDDIDGFSFYASYDLAECARWYYRDLNAGHEPMGADPLIADDGSIEITLYDMADDVKQILAVYYIDRFTAAGVDRGDTPVNLEPYTRTYGEGNAFEDSHVEDLTGSFAPQRKVLNEEGAAFGVWYLGYISPGANDRNTFGAYIRSILEYTGAASDCNIYIDMDDKCFAATNDGSEFYLIIPRSPVGTVTVKEYGLIPEQNTAIEGDTLYSGDGSAFLLKCNVSEIMPDVIVYIADEAGNTVSWSPGISGNDGRVLTYLPNGIIHDFTNYDKLATTDMVPRGEA